MSDEEIRKQMTATTLEYDMEEVDIRGSHAMLVISDGLRRTPLYLALLYLTEKYRPGGNVDKVLEDIADLRYADAEKASA